MRIGFSSFTHSMLREIGANGELAMRSQRKAYADRIKNPAMTEPATLDPHSAIAPPLRARRKYRMTRSSDRRNFEPNAAISGKQFNPKALTLYLSTRDRCELFAPCSLRRSSRNQISSLSVSLGLGVRPVALCHRPSFISSMDPRHSKTLKLRHGAIMDGA
jgi:hypothetical protein